MQRTYLAIYDNGKGYGEFEYYSEYRNNSKKNLEDARETLYRKYGYNRYTRNYEIKQTMLLNY